MFDADGIDDSEGGYTIKVKITKRGHRVEVDLSGSSRQAPTTINAGWLDTKTAVGVAFKMLFDPRSPFTSAAYRDIDIVLPEASVANAYPPDGPIFLYWESSQTLLNAILRALDKPLGERAVGGDFGSLSHPQRPRRARRRHAVAVRGPGRRRARPVGRDPRGRRRLLPGLLPGQQPRPGDRGDRGRHARGRAAQGVRAGHERRGLQPRRRGGAQGHDVPARVAPLLDAAAPQEAERHRRQRRRVRADGRHVGDRAGGVRRLQARRRCR